MQSGGEGDKSGALSRYSGKAVLTLAIYTKENGRERTKSSYHGESHGGEPCDGYENAHFAPFAKVEGISRRVAITKS